MSTANIVRKDMTKQRQAEVFEKQHERERAKAQAEANKDKDENTNKPRPHNPKAAHPDQIKSSNRGRRKSRAQAHNRY